MQSVPRLRRDNRLEILDSFAERIPFVFELPNSTLKRLEFVSDLFPRAFMLLVIGSKSEPFFESGE